MPSVTSLRTAYFTCWIGPGRCVRASLNSGLICKSPTTRSKLIKSRMPNRPMSGLQRVAASETHINVLRAERRPKSPPQADTDPASSPDAHASNANGRATETPTDAKAAANSQAKSNPTSVKPSQAHLVAPPPGRSLSIQYTNGYVYLGRPVPFTAGRVTRGKERERKKPTNIGSHSSAPGQRAAAIVYIRPTHRHHGDQQEDDRAYPQLGEQRAAPRRQHAVLRALDLVERTRRPRPRRVAGGPPSAPSRSCLSTCPLLLLVVGPRVVPVDLVPAVVLAALATPHFDGNPPVEGRLSACAMPAITE